MTASAPRPGFDPAVLEVAGQGEDGEELEHLGVVGPEVVDGAARLVAGEVRREFTVAEMLPSCAVLLGVGAVCFALGVLRLRRSSI